MAKISFAAIERAREHVSALEAALLRQRGWEHTCMTPGSYWLWKRELNDGRVLLLTQEHAVAMEARAAWELKPLTAPKAEG